MYLLRFKKISYLLTVLLLGYCFLKNSSLHAAVSYSLPLSGSDSSTIDSNLDSDLDFASPIIQSSQRSELFLCVSDILTKGYGGYTGLKLAISILQKIATMKKSDQFSDLLNECYQIHANYKNINHVVISSEMIKSSSFSQYFNSLAFDSNDNKNRILNFINKQISPVTYCRALDLSVAGAIIGAISAQAELSFCFSSTGNIWAEISPSMGVGTGVGISVTPYGVAVKKTNRDAGFSTTKYISAIFAFGFSKTNQDSQDLDQIADSWGNIKHESSQFGLGTAFIQTEGVKLNIPASLIIRNGKILENLFDSNILPLQNSYHRK